MLPTLVDGGSMNTEYVPVVASVAVDRLKDEDQSVAPLVSVDPSGRRR